MIYSVFISVIGFCISFYYRIRYRSRNMRRSHSTEISSRNTTTVTEGVMFPSEGNFHRYKRAMVSLVRGFNISMSFADIILSNCYKHKMFWKYGKLYTKSISLRKLFFCCFQVFNRYYISSLVLWIWISNTRNSKAKAQSLTNGNSL